MTEQQQYDVVIIGAGIIGVATARELQRRRPKAKIVILEKESDLALHQSGRNSGVIHAGVYYQPGSLKARFCIQGNRETKAFCRRHKIPFEVCGKLIVATEDPELPRLAALYQRCVANGIKVEQLTAAQLKEKAPNVNGIAALWVADSAIVNYRQLVQVMAQQFIDAGGEIRFKQHIVSIKEEVSNSSDYGLLLQCQHSQLAARQLISCAGLMADRLVAMCGIKPDFRILPFKGEYFLLDPKLSSVVDCLIYPVPDPKLPFLGIHLTKMIKGGITVGPNAVLSMKREGYQKWDWDRRECWQLLSSMAFWRLILRYWPAVLSEIKNSISRKAYLQQVKRYCPDIGMSDLTPYPCGIRAQAVSLKGELLSDFHFQSSPRTFHVCNAPSPAATSAFPIARYIVDKIASRL